MRGNSGEVEHDGRPELHVGLQHPVRAPRPELGQGRLLQGQGHLVPGRAEFLGGAAQHPGAGIFGPVHPVPEPHQPLAAVQHRRHVALGVPGPLDLLDHAQDARGRAAMQRPGHRADRPGQRGGHVGPGGGDHAGGEGRGIHAVLGRRRPVRVDRLHVPRVGFATPAGHEPLGDRRGLVHQALRDHGQPDATGGLRDEGQGHHRGPGEVLPGLVVADVEQLPQAPGGRQHGQRALHVDPDVTGMDRDRIRLGRRQPGREGIVDEKAPDMPVGDVADKLFNVNSPVAECAAFFVRLGDFRLEGDDAFKAWLEVRHRCFLSSASWGARGCYQALLWSLRVYAE